MNELEKLIFLHDPRGDAKTFLLTKEEMQEFINAAIAIGLGCHECGGPGKLFCDSCM